MKEDGNLVKDNWMGLTGDGTGIYFRTPGDEKRLALTEGVRISSDGNTVRRNTIAGAFTKAINIDGVTIISSPKTPSEPGLMAVYRL